MHFAHHDGDDDFDKMHKFLIIFHIETHKSGKEKREENWYRLGCVITTGDESYTCSV